MCEIAIKGLLDEDFVNYKKPSMFVSFPRCTFKCGIENCQNRYLQGTSNLNVIVENIVDRYSYNEITEALVCGGLEPLDSFEDLMTLLTAFRKTSQDTIVIYTGYNEDEVQDKIEKIKPLGNVIMKFGRYIPDQEKHKDEVLGVWLASNNQYAKQIA